MGWPFIVLMTALLNARHLLYSAPVAPWLGGRSRLERAAMAHVLTDETFALSLAPTKDRPAPVVQRYLRLVGPAILAALAAGNRPSPRMPPDAVALAVAVIPWRGHVFVGIPAAAVLVAVGRAAGA